VAFEALDNGIKSCADPQLLQRLSDGLTAEKIDRLLRKWLRRLPHPFPARDRAAGYRYQLSILQAEFSLTQVLDHPVTGRIFFEEVIRENLDIGRPSQVSLVFDRRINRRTPGRFRTRVITDGVVPSLHVDYRKSRIKQYHKEGEALRTETTINDTRDFGIGRRIKNLAELREIGFAANRRLLDVERIGHDCFIGEAAFQDLQKPVTVANQRAAALRFADPRVQGLLHILLLFLLVQGTFRNKDLREHIASLLAIKPSQLSPGRITYDLRRLRLHGLIERIPKTHRYRITTKGLRTAIFYTHLYNRSLRTGLAIISPQAVNVNLPVARSIRAAEAAINTWYDQQKIAA
jgi:DNA-binding HxlR family transcriptional regulator